jgi:carboxypeptidase PM20D1
LLLFAFPTSVHALGGTKGWRIIVRMIPMLLGAAVVLFVGFTLVRTARYGTAQAAVEPAPPIPIPTGAVERLAGSLRFPTISHEAPAAFDAEAFRALHAYLHAAFPKVHSQLRRETVGTLSLLYTWHGSDTSLKPILLMGHLDVVPVEPGTEEKWQEEPFGGRIAGGFIWGRGAIDNKLTVAGTLEAVEMLLGEGFRPARTVYLAYGTDDYGGDNLPGRNKGQRPSQPRASGDQLQDLAGR